MNSTSRRTPPSRLTFGVLVAGAVLAAWNGWLWLQELTTNPYANDFIAYYGGARVGVVAGWQRLYEVASQQQFEYGAGTHGWEPFVNPPPLAWLVAPLTVLPFQPADWAWSAALLAVISVAAFAAAPRGGFRPAAGTAACLGWFPTGFALLLGQAAILVAGGAVLAARLLVRRQDLLAGLALSTIALKPQDAILVPFALLAAGRVRAFAAWAIATGVLAAISVIELGGAGLHQAFDLLQLLETAPLNHRFAVEGVVGGGWPAVAAHALFGAAALYLAWRRRSSADAVVAIGLIGSFLVVPHVSLQDYSVIAIAGLLLLRSTRGWWIPALLALGFVAGEFAIPWGPIPLLAALVGLLAASLHHDQDGGAEQDDPDRREDAADHRQHHLE